MQKEFNTIHVLIVDDDQGDIDLTLEVLDMSKMKLNISVATDGVECMEYLKKAIKDKNVPIPDLILLDLNMPRKDGRQTLAEIKTHPELRKIPVVILTTSSADEDVIKTYTDGANCYITKPVGLDQLQKVVQMIESFWFTVVKLPTKR